MSEPVTEVRMTPCHPGEFIREEILNELHLPVARAAEIGARDRTPRHARPDLSVDQPVEHRDQARSQRGHRPSATTKSP